MNNKKVAAILLAASMVTTSLTGCGVSKEEEPVQDAEIVTVKEAEEDEHATKSLEKVVESVAVSNSSMAKKEETVFVKTSASGKVDSVVVSNWLQNTGNSKELVDNSDLSDIKNIKGRQNYTADGIEVVWDAEGDDIYYQGTSDKELPVDVEITYELNGQPIKPEELGGKAGHVKIRMNYINHAENHVDIGGSEETIYTPFAVVSGMLLDSKLFKNVTVTNGTVVSDGSNDVVVGMAFPGFVDSLNGAKLKDDDLLSKLEDKISIPSEVVVEADTSSFELGMTLTMVSSDAMNALGLDNLDFDASEDLDKLTEDMDEFEQAGKDLVDGTEKLRNGAKELSDGTSDLVSGTSDLYDGVVEYTDGVREVKDGTVKLRDGATELDMGMTTLKDGTGKVNDGAGALKDGSAQVSAGVNTLVDTVMGMGSSVGTAAQGAQAISNGIGQLVAATSVQTSADEIENGLKAKYGVQDHGSLVAAVKGQFGIDDDELAEGIISLVTQTGAASVNNAKSQINSAIVNSQAEGQQSLKDGADALAQGLAASAGMLANPSQAEQLKKLKEGAAAVASGASDLKDGTEQLADGASKLKNGTYTLRSGTQELVDGATELDGHSGELKDGSKELADGSIELVDGIDKLLNGTIELNDGMIKFDEEGIQKLTELFDTDYDSMRDRIHAITDAGKSYKSFTGAGEDEDSSVRFVLESAAIKR